MATLTVLAGLPPAPNIAVLPNAVNASTRASVGTSVLHNAWKVLTGQFERELDLLVLQYRLQDSLRLKRSSAKATETAGPSTAYLRRMALLYWINRKTGIDGY